MVRHLMHNQQVNMPRVAVDWRSASISNYKDFCKKNPLIKLTYKEWCNIIYDFNTGFRNYMLETGDKGRLPYGFGQFAVNKKKRKKVTEFDGKSFVNLPIDWKKTKEKGKVIYNFNFHTEGYFFGWVWFKESARIRNVKLWYFKPSRETSRSITKVLNEDSESQHRFKEWKN